MSEELPTIGHIHTACRGCVFANFNSAKDDKTQTGCSLGRTHKFKNQGCLVEATDGEENFFVVSGRHCKAFRNKNSDWAKKVHPGQRVGIVRGELTTKVDVIVPLEDDFEDELLGPTLHSLKEQRLAPTQVLIINNQGRVPRPKLMAYLMKEGEGLNWKFTQVVVKQEDGTSVSRERAIDLCIDNVTGDYYSVFRAGFAVPKTFVSDIDVAINDELERFSLLSADANGNGLTVQTALHKHPSIGGNRAIEVIHEGEQPFVLNNLVEKIRYHVKEQGQSYLVRNVGDVCKILHS